MQDEAPIPTYCFVASQHDLDVHSVIRARSRGDAVRRLRAQGYRHIRVHNCQSRFSRLFDWVHAPVR